MKHRLLHIVTLTVFVAAIFASVGSSLWPHRAAAAGISANDIRKSTLRWVNFGVIAADVGGQQLIFKRDTGSVNGFNVPGDTFKVQDYNCFGQITFDSFPNDGSAPSSAKLDLDYIPPDNVVNGGCQNVGSAGTTLTKSVAHPGNYKVYFTISSDLHSITAWNGDQNWAFSQSSQYATLFTRNSEDGKKCQDIISVNPTNGTYRLYELTSDSGNSNGPAPSGIHASGCYLAKDSTFLPVKDGESLTLGGAAGMTLAKLKEASKTAASVNVPGGGSGGGNSPDCESGGFSLNWALCPIFDAVAGMADWLFSQVVEPLLQTAPISTNPTDCNNGSGDCSYQIWSSFRIYGDIFLIIGLLVVVFGQSIGGGLIDAYTAKKILPRLLIAAILINLSIYIVAFLVDVTNIIGGSIGHLMTAPLKDAGAFKISPSGIQQAGIVGGGVAAGTIATFLSGLFFALAPALALSFFGHIAAFLALFVALPAVLGLLFAFVTLVARKAIILALVLVSPVAFALYCLPNTEKYFRKWWDFLIQTLLVYPLVVIFFAVADILSVTIMHANGISGGSLLTQTALAGSSTLAAIIAFLLQFLPLLFIPYAFRIAGGAVGRLHDVLTNARKSTTEAIKGNVNDPNSLRNRVKGNVGADFARGRAQQYRTLKNWGAERSGRRRLGGRLASLSTVVGDPLAREAALNEESKKRIFQIKDNGDDSIINARASFVDEHGVRRTLDGKTVNDADYRAAKRIYPRLSDIQAVADYRSTKPLTTQEAFNFANNYARMAQQEGMSLDEANGAFTALGFARQVERGEWKHGSISQGGDGQFHFQPVGDSASFEGGSSSRSSGFVKEAYSKRGSFEAGKAFSSFYQSTADIKQRDVGFLEDIKQRRASGGAISTQELAEETAARDRLRMTLENEKAWEYSGVAVNEEGERVQKGGLSGASAETQAAFERLKATGADSDIVKALGRQIEGTKTRPAQTYENINTQDPGDFTGRYT